MQDRGSSSIILARPYPEGRSHEAVTFAWFGRVGGSGLLELTRIPPSDSLIDKKSLTTSAPQSQRRESRCLGFVLVEANLPGMHLLPWRKSFAEAIPATPNLLVASTEDIPLVEEDFLGTPPALTQTSPGSGCSFPTIFDSRKWLLSTK